MRGTGERFNRLVQSKIDYSKKKNGKVSSTGPTTTSHSKIQLTLYEN
eukprot:CAMPEP_0116885862 /NCGR_PEP_ID=MMETSP0463-20121206/19473_1 /TAXON_ID=181622 /ORGANISM="Strombidinopsis sp, Strain SopsisLIS2011" /LENGTH=46 /DNA_ID= /DNA_START= /DNA_END= /DNA_ORIENTATION=